MTKFNQDITVVSGSNKTLRFTIENDDAIPVAALDITTATFRFAMAPKPGDTASLVKTTGFTIVSGTGGIVDLDVDDADWPAADSYYYELKVTIAGKVSTVTAGRINVLKTS